MAEAYINYPLLWQHVIAHFPCGPHSIHGPEHWRRVERNGLLIAEQSGADETVVRLFALFHDSQRVNDGWDDGHGTRGAKFAFQCRGEFFEISDDMFEKLYFACAWHTDELYDDDPTIGTCWDADRLDLPRAGIKTDPDYLNTAFGKELAKSGNLSF